MKINKMKLMYSSMLIKQQMLQKQNSQLIIVQLFSFDKVSFLNTFFELILPLKEY
jgi:hypothetical protein